MIFLFSMLNDMGFKKEWVQNGFFDLFNILATNNSLTCLIEASAQIMTSVSIFNKRKNICF